MPRRVRQIALTAACVVFTELAAAYLAAYSPQLRAYTPAQPLPFDHMTHSDAGTPGKTAGMPCLACHPGAESAAAAGLPADATCLDCHRHILADDARLRPLHAAANADSPFYTGEALRWRRASSLPGHAHFHHGQHAAKGVACAECHANPGTAAPARMADCLDCHRRHSLPANCAACHY